MRDISCQRHYSWLASLVACGLWLPQLLVSSIFCRRLGLWSHDDGPASVFSGLGPRRNQGGDGEREL